MNLYPVKLFKPCERINLKNIEFTEVGNKIYEAKSTLENYAKKNDVKIFFDLSKNNDNAEKLNIVVTDNNILNINTFKTSVNPDINAVETVRVNDKLTSEDTFLKRVFRGVSELTQKINKVRADRQADMIETILAMETQRNLTCLL